MSFSQIEKEELATMIEAVVKPLIRPLKIELDRQAVLFEASEERATMALTMLSTQLGSEMLTKENAARIRHMLTTLKVHKATLHAHEKLLQVNRSTI